MAMEREHKRLNLDSVEFESAQRIEREYKRIKLDSAESELAPLQENPYFAYIMLSAVLSHNNQASPFILEQRSTFVRHPANNNMFSFVEASITYPTVPSDKSDERDYRVRLAIKPLVNSYDNTAEIECECHYERPNGLQTITSLEPVIPPTTMTITLDNRPYKISDNLHSITLFARKKNPND
jgi:hypothetical protein